METQPGTASAKLSKPIQKCFVRSFRIRDCPIEIQYASHDLKLHRHFNMFRSSKSILLNRLGGLGSLQKMRPLGTGLFRYEASIEPKPRDTVAQVNFD